MTEFLLNFGYAFIIGRAMQFTSVILIIMSLLTTIIVFINQLFEKPIFSLNIDVDIVAVFMFAVGVIIGFVGYLVLSVTPYV